MGFFDDIKNIKNQINKIETTVYQGNRSLLEVYELNAKLEAEIAARTTELETANKQMLTLHHILDMMNSSRPLSSDTAVRVFDLLIDRSPTWPKYYVERANYKKALGDRKGYEADIAKAKELSPVVDEEYSIIKDVLYPKTFKLDCQ